VNRLDRLYALAEQLRAAAPRARTARQLADTFEVSVRTIERDLSALQQAGVPIWATPGPGGGYSVDPAMTLPPLNFTADEAAAVTLALSMSGSIPVADAARSALHKLVAAMSTSSREGARDLAGRIALLQTAGELQRTPVVKAVEQAVARRRMLEIDYVDRCGERTQARQVEPHGFAGIEGRWYLMGWCRLRSGGRSFRLDRIETARVTAEVVTRRNLDELLGDMPGDVRSLVLEEG
jgi:predicted DNA-binding transcriptional regulator YafY